MIIILSLKEGWVEQIVINQNMQTHLKTQTFCNQKRGSNFLNFIVSWEKLFHLIQLDYNSRMNFLKNRTLNLTLNATLLMHF